MNKKLTLLLLLIISVVYSYAQPFGANNAIWHYNLYYQFPQPHNSPVTVTSSPDTVFNGDTCRILSIIGGSGCYFTTDYIVKQSNDTVYYWLQGSNRFAMLYNYNAMVGDTQTIYGMGVSGADTSVQLVVTAAGTININGFIKRTYTLAHTPPTHYFDFEGIVIEDIGNTSFLFPQFGFCDPIISEFRCYEDSVIGLHNVQLPFSCNAIIWVGINEQENDRYISVSPNPFSSEILITIQKRNFRKATYTAKNILNQTVYSSNENNLINHSKTIDLSFLRKGIYFLDVIIDGQQIVRKIVKE